MQYLKQPGGSIISFAPVFVTNDKGEEIQVTFTSGEPVTKAAYDEQEANLKAIRDKAQAEASNLAQERAIEREAIDEVIREQFSKQIAERAEKKKAKLEKQKNKQK